MKIAHCIASIDKNSGGTTTACIDLIEQLKTRLDRVYLYTLMSENTVLYSVENGGVFFSEPSFMGYSRELNKELRLHEVDVFHGHALWNLPIHQMAVIARKKSVPYIMSIHGMLEPWSLKQSVLKKTLAMALYQKKDLMMAFCLHATAMMEVNNIRKLGLKKPIALIPNGINISEYPLKDYSIKKDKRKILFLSRIHPKKGIEYLINAWERLQEQLKQNWEVEIAGNGDSDYINALNDLIKEKNLQNQIRIVGPKFGKDKTVIYHSADLFVLPTYSENFGIVIAEALASGVPVITTTGTPWEELEKYQAGKWIDINEESLANAMSFLMNKNKEELKNMGLNGRKLIEENYSIESVAEKFVMLYQWVITGKNKPNFVYK